MSAIMHEYELRVFTVEIVRAATDDRLGLHGTLKAQLTETEVRKINSLIAYML